MFDYAQAAVEGALSAGATYADARVVVRRSQRLSCLNQVIEGLNQDEDGGVGVRALIGSSWGFFATQDLSDASARNAGQRAADIARASALVAGPPLELADVAVKQTHWQTPYAEDPFAVPLGEKADLLVALTATIQAVDGIQLARANLTFWDTDKWFVSSQNHRISQHIVESGGGMSATALGENETQVRSYPQSFGQFETGGYEVIRRFRHAGPCDAHR